MEQLFNEYSSIIDSYTIYENSVTSKRSLFHAQIRFVNLNKLTIREIIVFLDKHSVKRKYSYQWMHSDNSLIIRWDNAPHHKYIETFPYHKHLSTDENIQPEPEISLVQVLEHIKASI